MIGWSRCYSFCTCANEDACKCAPRNQPLFHDEDGGLRIRIDRMWRDEGRHREFQRTSGKMECQRDTSKYQREFAIWGIEVDAKLRDKIDRLTIKCHVCKAHWPDHNRGCNQIWGVVEGMIQAVPVE